MNYKTLTINTALPSKPRAKVMIIYTGGTFGMVHDSKGVLLPFDFSLIVEHLPTLRNLFLEITVISFEDPIDSSNIEPAHWQMIGAMIYEHYDRQDGFVVLHVQTRWPTRLQRLVSCYRICQSPLCLRVPNYRSPSHGRMPEKI